MPQANTIATIIHSLNSPSVIDWCQNIMKIFRSTLKFYQICGNNQPQPSGRLNPRIVVISIFTFLFFVSLVVTFLFKSTTLNEYFDALCVLLTVVASSVNTFECFWKQTKVIAQIQRMEKTIGRSKFFFSVILCMCNSTFRIKRIDFHYRIK